MVSLIFVSFSLVYSLNPKMIANYKKSFLDLSKTDPIDAFVIADFARVGRINVEPWRGSQYLALQRLTRHRLHLVDFVYRTSKNRFANPEKVASILLQAARNSYKLDEICRISLYYQFGQCCQ